MWSSCGWCWRPVFLVSLPDGLKAVCPVEQRGREMEAAKSWTWWIKRWRDYDTKNGERESPRVIRMRLPSIFYNCSSCSGSTGAAAFPSIHWDRDRVNQGRADSLREQEWGKETLKRHSERGKGRERKRGDEEWKKTDKGTCEADGKEAD